MFQWPKCLNKKMTEMFPWLKCLNKKWPKCLSEKKNKCQYCHGWKCRVPRYYWDFDACLLHAAQDIALRLFQFCHYLHCFSTSASAVWLKVCLQRHHRPLEGSRVDFRVQCQEVAAKSEGRPQVRSANHNRQVRQRFSFHFSGRSTLEASLQFWIFPPIPPMSTKFSMMHQSLLCRQNFAGKLCLRGTKDNWSNNDDPRKILTSQCFVVIFTLKFLSL